MAKVAKKSASSAKKSVTTKKVVAKKTEQKKTPVKVTPTASKKKVVEKPVAQKAAPSKKVVSKKVVAKKAVKPVPVKKTPAKVVAKKGAAVKAKVSVAKPDSKKATAVAKPATKKTVPVQIAKKVAAVATKSKTAVAKKVVEKIVPKKVEVVAPKVKSVVVTPTPEIGSKVPAKPRRKKKKKDDDDDDEEVVVFRKPVKSTKSAVAKKLSSKYVSEELTMEGPAPKRVGPITMTSDEKIKLKKALLNKCIDIQKNTVSISKKAMEDALTSANAEKVTEELSDSFRESMHATRDMYARQANEGVNNLGLLNRINIVEHDKVRFGSVVFTNFQNYFISTGLGEIKVDDLSFQAVSTLAPLFQILVDKRKGDTFMFLDRLYTVIEVF